MRRWEHSIKYYTTLLRRAGVNALRVPVAVDNVLIDPPPTTSAWRDPEASKSDSSLDILTQLVRAAASDGLLVLLDMHRLVGEIWPDPDGLWYSPLVPEEAVHAAWRVLARRFCGEVRARPASRAAPLCVCVHDRICLGTGLQRLCNHSRRVTIMPPLSRPHALLPTALAHACVRSGTCLVPTC